MRIVISGRAALYPESEYLVSDPRAVPITDPEILESFDGCDGELEDELSDDIDSSLTDAGVTGGTLTFVYDTEKNELRTVTEYRCTRLLTKKELSLLTEETVGAWSDGIAGLDVMWDGGEGCLYPNPPGYPLGKIKRDLRVEQLAE